MIKREGFPIVAKTAMIDIIWKSADTDSVEFIGGRIAFDNVNQTTAGPVLKERTSLQFVEEDPIDWPDDIPQNIKDIWSTPEDALAILLGILYESDEHQYKLGTKIPPQETE
jgi:hypothetical protein